MYFTYIVYVQSIHIYTHVDKGKIQSGLCGHRAKPGCKIYASEGGYRRGWRSGWEKHPVKYTAGSSPLDIWVPRNGVLGWARICHQPPWFGRDANRWRWRASLNHDMKLLQTHLSNNHVNHLRRFIGDTIF